LRNIRPKRPVFRLDCEARSNPRGGSAPCGERPTGVVGALGRTGAAGSACGGDPAVEAEVVLDIDDDLPFPSDTARFAAPPPALQTLAQIAQRPSEISVSWSFCVASAGPSDAL
jgi:hypothetical protein